MDKAEDKVAASPKDLAVVGKLQGILQRGQCPEHWG
jgi:hypothetical protein